MQRTQSSNGDFYTVQYTVQQWQRSFNFPHNFSLTRICIYNNCHVEFLNIAFFPPLIALAMKFISHFTDVPLDTASVRDRFLCCNRCNSSKCVSKFKSLNKIRSKIGLKDIMTFWSVVGKGLMKIQLVKLKSPCRQQNVYMCMGLF